MSSFKPRALWRVGTEAEKFGLLSDTLAPLPFVGSRSVQRVLALFVERHGWHPEREHPQGDVIALSRGASSITLEPAGQLELSGAPFASIHDTAAEFNGHLAELHGISADLGIVWLSLGFHAFARHEDLPRVTKQRYGIMEKYLPTRGPRALDMMRRTCTVQANLDYESEDDAIRKLRVALALQPIVTGIFAHSPFVEGKRGQNLSERAAVWLEMDPDRSGILPFAWDRDMSLRSYVEWALDVPMFMIKRGERVIANTNQTFRAFLAHGVAGERATRHDWEMHLNTLFPEVRLKRTLEVRGADAQRAALTAALPALWKGLLYNARALTQAERLVSGFDPRQLAEARPDIARRALAAQLGGRPLREWAQRVLEIAVAGLQLQAADDARSHGEDEYLAPLSELVARGMSPADELLAATDASTGPELRAKLVEHTRV